MTTAKTVKQAGLPSLAFVSKVTGVNPQTLDNWHNKKPELFRIVLQGCKTEYDRMQTLETA